MTIGRDLRGLTLFVGPAFRAALACLLALIVVGTTGPVSRSVHAEHWSPPRTVYVPATGHTVDGLFLDLWRAEPDLLGNPITEEFLTEVPADRDGAGSAIEPRTDGTVTADVDLSTRGDAPRDQIERIVQYYRNLALVYLPDAPAGEQVGTLPLGRDVLKLALRGRHRPSALTVASGPTECAVDDEGSLTFVETSHTLRGDFRVFWEERGGAHLLGLPLTEPFRADDGATIQYFEGVVLRQRAGKSVTPQPLGREVARRLKLTTQRVDQPQDVPIYDESLFIAPPEPEPEAQPAPSVAAGGVGPGPQQGGPKEIVVSISGQMLWAYEDGALLVSTLVSTGTAEVLETTTPVGYHQILTKYELETMEGTISEEHYRVEDVPDVMYFDNLGNALHGTYWHNAFGTPMSHGCVNLPLEVAAFLYDWAPIGTPVTIIA